MRHLQVYVIEESNPKRKQSSPFTMPIGNNLRITSRRVYKLNEKNVNLMSHAF